MGIVAPGKYQDSDRQMVYAGLAVSGGNVRRTARDTGYPEQTVRDWKKRWEAEGAPEVVASGAVPIVDQFYEKARTLRDLLLVKLEERIAADDITTKDVITSIGILTDKIRLIEGLPTNRTENVSKGMSPEELGAAIGSLAKGALEAAKERQSDLNVIEGNTLKALPRPPA